jgi:large subunit ribosomal protein L6
MSRIGKQPISLPKGVEVRIDGTSVNVKGKNGEMTLSFHPNMTVVHDADAGELRVTRPNDNRENRALHGSTRSLINNMVVGVETHFEKRLEIVGVGYQVTIDGSDLHLQVGFSNAVTVVIPANVICELPDNTHILCKSIDKQAVGQFAANVRRVRPPEPYKGKGIRYQDEHVRRKSGKAFASTG